jgi:hypothetical protein
MDLKSKYFNGSFGKQCQEIPKDAMMEMIGELSSNAIFVMSTDMDAAVTVRTAEMIVYQLKQTKLNVLPFHLVVEGFTRGSMGELGGTSKFNVRNVSIWMHAMYDKHAQIAAEKKTKEDIMRRDEEAKNYKSNYKTSSLYGMAMYRKLEWCYAGLVSSEEYDRLSLDKIVAAMQKGYKLKELQPNMIL